MRVSPPRSNGRNDTPILKKIFLVKHRIFHLKKRKKKRLRDINTCWHYNLKLKATLIFMCCGYIYRWISLNTRVQCARCKIVFVSSVCTTLLGFFFSNLLLILRNEIHWFLDKTFDFSHEVDLICNVLLKTEIKLEQRPDKLIFSVFLFSFFSLSVIL